MKTTFRSFAALAVLVALVMAIVPAAQAKSGTLIETALNGSAAFPGAHGKAKFKREGGQREFEAEFEDARRLAGQRVILFVGGNRVGTMLVNRFGTAHFERNTELGQRVPFVARGTRVGVRTFGGTLVVSGRF
jgi:hypothetical protein